MTLTYLSLSSIDCPSSALTAPPFAGPSTETKKIRKHSINIISIQDCEWFRLISINV